MGRRLFLFLFAGLIGVISSPQSLIATDSFEVSEPDFHAVETIPLPETPEIKPQNVAIKTTTTVKATNSTVNTPMEAAPVYVAPANNIFITGRTLEIVNVNDTIYDAGNHVNRYGGKFLYGHNSGAVFGGLVNMGIGSTFSVTTNGVTQNYRVANVVIFEKNTGNGKLQLNGKGSYMRAVADAVHLGVHYGLSIMTCYGTSYGNGDASHRLVLFANAI